MVAGTIRSWEIWPELVGVMMTESPNTRFTRTAATHFSFRCAALMGHWIGCLCPAQAAVGELKRSEKGPLAKAKATG
jgi:hypothetical protein